MKNRFLWIMCALLSLLVLTGGCNRKPASTADVPRSLSHQYKIAVAPFTQPRDISQLIMGQLPQPQALAARDVLVAQDRQLRDVLYTSTKRSYDFLPRTRPLPDLKRLHTSERPQALPLWGEYARKTSADILLIPQVLTWRDRQGSAAGVTEPAHVRLEFFLLNIKEGNIIGHSVYEVEQQGLTENLLNVGDFFKRQGKWVTADELAREAMTKAVKDLNL
ncbi:hypothetical protein [Desulfovibrio piger]|uniref:hypothetical protein n=1 Tax=Desulfovibrio piger TaxID=901 RepID=UPI0024312000|nr:hypothetical protein [Desulfovibrio piger]MCI6939871.1 hypothetical protein [Desulfovibrio piger]